MKTDYKIAQALKCSALALLLFGLEHGLMAQEPPEFPEIRRLTNAEVVLRLSAPTGLFFRVETSTNLAQWQPLLTFLSVGTNISQHTDSAAPFLGSRFYRATHVPGTNVLAGDHVPTDEGEVVIRVIDHASFVMSWQGKWIYNDPVGGAGLYRGLPKADLILVSHDHGDHYDAGTLNAVRSSNTVILTPRVVFQQSTYSATLKSLTTVLTNGSATNLLGLTVEAIPAYNTTPARASNHRKGVGNGYVVTMGGKRFYMCGDTEDIPEMRALQNIDVAFICMNLPFTMTVQQAASAVREFRPKIVYPYHYSSSDVNLFKRLVGTDVGVEVRLRKWE